MTTVTITKQVVTVTPTPQRIVVQPRVSRIGVTVAPGIRSFLALIDTPSSFEGGRVLAAKMDGSGLEYIDVLESLPPISYNDLTDLPATFAPSAHQHSYTDLLNIPATFAPSTHQHDYSTLLNIPTTFAPSAHTHVWSAITNPPSTLAGYGITDLVAFKNVDNQFSVAQGIRGAASSLAAGLSLPWVSGDTLTTLVVGSTTGGMDQIAIAANTYSNVGVQAVSGTGTALKGLTTSGNALMGRVTDAATTGLGIVLAIQHRTSGSPITAGFGAALKFQLQSTTANDQDAAQIASGWLDPTHISRSAYLAFATVNNAGALAEQMRITAAGAALHRSTDNTQAAGMFVPWVSGDTLTTLVVGSGGTHSTTGLTVRAGTSLALYAVATTGTPLFGERLSSTVTNTSPNLLILKHTAATPANTLAGYGVGVGFQLSSTTTAGRSSGSITSLWSDPADATFTSALAFSTALNAAAIAERARIDAGAGANTTGFMLWDVNSGTVKRVQVGAADSGGGWLSFVAHSELAEEIQDQQNDRDGDGGGNKHAA